MRRFEDQVEIGMGMWGADEAAVDRSWPLARPNYTSLAAAVQGEVARWNIPGMTVSVLHDGQVETVATGVASMLTKQPVTADTIFQIGSISKIFTATATMILVDEGKLDLDEPIVTYLPDWPLADEGARAKITLRNVFEHSSGYEGDTFTDFGRGDDANAIAVSKMGELEQWFQPGEIFSYNNNGYTLAGLLIEKVTGKTFEAFVKERILDPLKLENTMYFAENAITYPHAVGHQIKKREDGYTIARPYAFPRHINAPGGVIGTTEDLIRFAQMHANGGELDGVRILSEQSAKLMQTPKLNSWDQFTSFGQGWYISEYKDPDLTIVQHGGATNGFKAILRFSVEKGFAFAALTNGDPGATVYDQIYEWALKHYLDFELPKPPVIELSKKKLDRLTGLYAKQNNRMVVTREGDVLRLRGYEVDPETGEEKEGGLFGGEVLRLEPIESTRANDFRVAGGAANGMILDFPEVPTKDDPNRILLRLGGRVAKRITQAPEPDDAKPEKKSARDKKK